MIKSALWTLPPRTIIFFHPLSKKNIPFTLIILPWKKIFSFSVKAESKGDLMWVCFQHAW